jgi:hypothetical protein
MAISVWAESKRERSREAYGGEREKIGRKKERVGPVTVLNWNPHEFSPNFEFGLDSKTGQKVNSNLAWDPYKIQVGISILT